MNDEVCYLLTEDTDMASKATTFIDLFCGIGGVRLGFESAGCKCVLSCDWDKYAQKTYEANFGEKPIADIRELRSGSIPKHDLLTGWFPCQPFSISGVSKKNSLGRPHGFEDNRCISVRKSFCIPSMLT